MLVSTPIEAEDAKTGDVYIKADELFLKEALRQIKDSEDVRRRFVELGFELIEDTPSQFAASIRSDIDSVARIVRGAQLKLSESR